MYKSFIMIYPPPYLTNVNIIKITIFGYNNRLESGIQSKSVIRPLVHNLDDVSYAMLIEKERFDALWDVDDCRN